MPTRFINELASDMNALVGSILSEDSASSGFTPAMDIEETETGYELTVDVPGVKPADINIALEDDQVIVSGTRHAKADGDEQANRRSERSWGEFRRSVRLPEAVDQDRIEASYELGVLTIQLPKIPKKVPRKIVINQVPAQPEEVSGESSAN
jgi:HSP20 family protein